MGIPVWISRGLEVPSSVSRLPERTVEVALSGNVSSQPVAGIASPNASAHLSSLTAELQSTDAKVVAEAKPNIDVSTPTKPKAGLHAADDLIRDLQKTSSNKIAEIAASIDDEPVAKAPAPLTPIEDLEALGWSELQQTVMACTACDLHNLRQQTVFGRGSTQAKWMIVGDIPRLEDEWKQHPFSGESGELLDGMLASIGVESNSLYITNLLKCRPPLDRAPDQEQAASCLSYLRRQIDLLKPTLIILMGRDTIRQVLGSNEPMARLRQQVHQREGISAPMVATYHPAYLLKQPRLKLQTWQDLQFAKRAMQ